MKIFLKLFLIFISLSGACFANSEGGNGFYVGVDPSKTNGKIGNANNAVSLDSKVAEDRYYGYKFNSGGFFLAPEVSMQNSSNTLSTQNLGGSTANSGGYQKSNQLGAVPGVTYDMRANIGYEFTPTFSGFLTYDLGSFAYGAGQRSVVIGSNRANNSAVGIGSQINLSTSFGIKLMYSQQQFENSAVGGGQIRSDVVKFGTVYSF